MKKLTDGEIIEAFNNAITHGPRKNKMPEALTHPRKYFGEFFAPSLEREMYQLNLKSKN